MIKDIIFFYLRVPGASC